MKKIKKYFYVYKMALLEEYTYKYNVLISLPIYIAIITIFMGLWKNIFRELGNNIINGFSIFHMLWYLLISECLWLSMASKTITDEVTEDIKTGKVIYMLIKPYYYPLFLLVKYFGAISLKLVVFSVISVSFGYVFLGSLGNFNLMGFIFAIIGILVGILINSMIRLIISVGAFWIEDSRSIHRIYNKLSIVFGVIFPIDILPSYMQSIFSYLPVYPIIQGPVRMLMSCDIKFFLKNILPIQIVYIVLLFSYLSYIYKKGLKVITTNAC